MKSPTPSQVLFTFAEAAAMTTLPETWLRSAARERRIPFRKIGKHYRFSQADLDAIAADNAQTVVPSPLKRVRRSA